MDEGTIRKGPWMAEEDEILMDYVSKYGPRDWSAVRSKGLLPRTGKSCRLRWVNKLKPGLKTGCKFSVEEERVVIDLQARFGNKWARIATYLPGRTDNDVKNFWSTRQKRLSRILLTQTPLKSPKNHEKFPMLHECHILQGECSQISPVNSDIITMVRLPDLINQNSLNLANDRCTKKKRTPKKVPVPQPVIAHIPQYPLELQLPPENPYPVAGFYDRSNFPDVFVWREDDDGLKLPLGLPLNNVATTPDSFFDDFPADMFDYLEPLPTSVGLPDW